MREIAEIILSKDVATSDGIVTGKYAVLAEVIKKALHKEGLCGISK